MGSMRQLGAPASNTSLTIPLRFGGTRTKSGECSRRPRFSRCRCSPKVVGTSSWESVATKASFARTPHETRNLHNSKVSATSFCASTTRCLSRSSPLRAHGSSVPVCGPWGEPCCGVGCTTPRATAKIASAPKQGYKQGKPGGPRRSVNMGTEIRTGVVRDPGRGGRERSRHVSALSGPPVLLSFLALSLGG